MYVLKFGGSSLSSPQKILLAAQHVAQLHQKSKKVLVVVSAMGKSTDQLISLAKQVSPLPDARELDMLLTTGERVSMALLCMALHDLKCPAISFTGSQAGILTEGSHFSARIKDIISPRVNEALGHNKVVVLAGFQGFDPVTREITTLGRGGSDTTAVAMAKHLRASHCHILKDVTAVYTADPNVVATARPHTKLSYEHLQSMCFWGAKVLHARSVNLASQTDMNLAIGYSENFEIGTLVENDKGDNMPFEENQVIAVNTLDHVHELKTTMSLLELLNWMKSEKLTAPQLLKSDSNDKGLHLHYSGDIDSLSALKHKLEKLKSSLSLNDNLSCVTLTCHKSIGTELLRSALEKLSTKKIPILSSLENFNSISFIIERESKAEVTQLLHEFI